MMHEDPYMSWPCDTQNMPCDTQNMSCDTQNMRPCLSIIINNVRSLRIRYKMYDKTK